MESVVVLLFYDSIWGFSRPSQRTMVYCLNYGVPRRNHKYP